MKQKEGIVMHEVCGNPVLMFASQAGKRRMCQLSETAAWIWNEAAAQGEFTIDSITEALCQEYEVDVATAHADVTALLTQWQQEGIVE